MTLKQMLTSKTVWAALVGAVFRVLQNPKDPNSWGEGAAIVLGGVGVRDAIQKSGPQPPA